MAGITTQEERDQIDQLFIKERYWCIPLKIYFEKLSTIITE
jgi:hypothetical protein